jgi:predicted phage terminase large subunit-like protein
MTPRKVKIVEELVERDDVVITRGSTYENASNLSKTFIEEVVESYRGTSLARQEIYGELLNDVDGALWRRSTLDENRRQVEPKFNRVIIGVDPSMTGGDRADETGIVVVGQDQDKHGYVIADYSMKGSPNQWAQRVVRAYHDHEANLIVAERNQGGELVRDTMLNIDRGLPIKLVFASKGKVARAEPVSALDEQGKIHHVGVFPKMEDEMCCFVPGDIRESPNRVDARVWALTELLVQGRRGGTWGRRLRSRVLVKT